MKNNKKTVVYARTASKKQNIDLQLKAAEPFLSGIHDENILIIADSVTPRSSQPKGLQKLLELIKSDQVDTLIVFHRDRLTRSFDEYLKMLKLIYEREIKVIFTAREHVPFNHDQNTGLISESLFLLFIEMERTNMSKRRKAAMKRKQS